MFLLLFQVNTVLNKTVLANMKKSKQHELFDADNTGKSATWDKDGNFKLDFNFLILSFF